MFWLWQLVTGFLLVTVPPLITVVVINLVTLEGVYAITLAPCGPKDRTGLQALSASW